MKDAIELKVVHRATITEARKREREREGSNKRGEKMLLLGLGSSELSIFLLSQLIWFLSMCSVQSQTSSN